MTYGKFLVTLVLLLGFVVVFVEAFTFRGALNHIEGCGSYHTLNAVRHCLRTGS